MVLWHKPGCFAAKKKGGRGKKKKKPAANSWIWVHQQLTTFAMNDNE